MVTDYERLRGSSKPAPVDTFRLKIGYAGIPQNKRGRAGSSYPNPCLASCLSGQPIKLCVVPSDTPAVPVCRTGKSYLFALVQLNHPAILNDQGDRTVPD